MGIRRNEPCWCGSGLNFKQCHLVRQHEEPVLLSTVKKKSKSASKISKCLHPNAASGVCGAIIKAHTVQRSRVLKTIVGNDNHVLSFHQRYSSGEQYGPFRVGWNTASTITGFCSKHDNEAFAPLEKYPFTMSRQQCFLLGYRSLCHEIYEKTCSLTSFEIFSSIVDRGYNQDNQQIAQEYIHLLKSGTQRGLQDLCAVKQVRTFAQHPTA